MTDTRPGPAPRLRFQCSGDVRCTWSLGCDSCTLMRWQDQSSKGRGPGWLLGRAAGGLARAQSRIWAPGGPSCAEQNYVRVALEPAVWQGLSWKPGPRADWLQRHPRSQGPESKRPGGRVPLGWRQGRAVTLLLPPKARRRCLEAVPSRVPRAHEAVARGHPWPRCLPFLLFLLGNRVLSTASPGQETSSVCV